MKTNGKRITIAAACAVALMCGGMSRAGAESPLAVEELQAIRIATVDPSNQAVLMDFRVVDLLKLGGNDTVIPIRQRISTRPDGKYFVSFSLKAGSDDVVFSVQKRGVSWFYRTDSTRTLRAAAVLDVKGGRAVPVANAMASFDATLQVWSDLVRNNMPSQ